MPREILDAGLADESAVAAATEGFAEFREKLAAFDLKTVSALTEIPAADIRKAAHCIGRSANTAFYYTMGVTQFIFGTNNVLAVSQPGPAHRKHRTPQNRREPPARTEQRPGRLRHGRVAQCAHRLPLRDGPTPYGAHSKRPGESRFPPRPA